MSDSLSREPLTTQVHHAIVAYIDEQGLLPGDGLPSTAALAERFNVSRPVVREAMSSLVAVGLIEVSNGRNATVRELDERLVSLYLSRAIRATTRPLTALMELRAPLEVEAASLAARRADAEARSSLTALADQLDGAVGDGEAYVRLDLELHRAIASASGNPALLGITDAVRSQVFQAMTLLRAHREARDLVGSEHQEHLAIIEAVVAGHEDGAAKHMSDHMRTTAVLVADIEGPAS